SRPIPSRSHSARSPARRKSDESDPACAHHFASCVHAKAPNPKLQAPKKSQISNPNRNNGSLRSSLRPFGAGVIHYHLEFGASLGFGTWSLGFSQRLSAVDDPSAVWMQHLSAHVGRIVRRQKHEGRRDFLGFARSPDRRVRTKRRHPFRRESRWNQRS